MKTTAAAALALLVLSLAWNQTVALAQTAQSRAPVALVASSIPPVLPADSGNYSSVMVSLLDARNSPTLSLSDVVVYLSSSNETVVSVPPTATLLAGHSFLQVGLNTTKLPGSATITVASPGLASAFVNVRTMKPAGAPTSLSLLVAPSRSIRALGGADDVFAIQLQNAGGTPAVSGDDTYVVVTSSNSSLVNRTIDTTIPAGADVVYGRFSVGASGTATLDALSSGLETGSAQFSVESTPRSVVITATPSQISAGDVAYLQFSVEVLGMPVSGANLTLSASLGDIVPATLITGASGQATAKYISGSAGPATVTAVASTHSFGIFSGSTTLMVAASTTSTGSSGEVPMLESYVPVVVVAVVVVLGFLVVRNTLKKRRGTVDEDLDPETQATP